MNYITTSHPVLPEVLKFSARVFPDNRGTFEESYNKEIQEILGDNFIPCQDNISISKKGVARGMHWQLPPFAQAKFVHCAKGEITDIFIDIRKNSLDFCKAGLFVLKQGESVFIPEGFAHGFIANDNAVVTYKVNNVYNKASARSFNINSLKDLNQYLNINLDNLILSEQDLLAPSLSTVAGRYSHDLF